MLQENIISHIKNTVFFNDLSDSQLSNLSKILTIETYKSGSVLFKENDSSRDLYYILSGNVKLSKKSKQRDVTLRSIGKNKFFGEMSFIDGKKRSAKVVVSSKEIKIIKFDYNLLAKNAPDMLNLIISKISAVIIYRLRKSNISNVKNINEKLNQLKVQNEFGSFFIAVIVAIGITNLINKIVDVLKLSIKPGYSELLYSWITLIMVCTPFMLLIYFFDYRVREFGINTKNLKVSIIESVSIVIITITTLYFITYFVPDLLNLFIVHNYSIGMDNIFLTLKMFTYFVHSFIQEWIARGILQTSIQKFLNDKNGIKAVLITSTIFSISSLQISISFAILTFIISIFLGSLYNRHKNIWGVSIIHFTIGVFAVYYGIL